MSTHSQGPRWLAFEMSADQLELELSDQVYSASVGIFEHAESSKILRGNGHHMAQELAREAVRIWRAHLNEEAKS